LNQFHKNRVILGLILLSIFSCLFLAPSYSSVLAQPASYAAVSQIATDHFPEISFNLTVHDESGAFLSGLTAGDIKILEDKYQRDASQVHYSEPGLQVILALNPAPSFWLLRRRQGPL